MVREDAPRKRGKRRARLVLRIIDELRRSAALRPLRDGRVEIFAEHDQRRRVAAFHGSPRFLHSGSSFGGQMDEFRRPALVLRDRGVDDVHHGGLARNIHLEVVLLRFAAEHGGTHDRIDEIDEHARQNHGNKQLRIAEKARELLFHERKQLHTDSPLMLR